MFLARLPRVFAGLLLAASLGVGPALAQPAPSGVQRSNHYKFLGSWWTAGDTQQPEANKIDVRSPPNRTFQLIVSRANLGLNDVVLYPDPVGTRYASDEFRLKVPGTTWGRPVVLRLEVRNGKYWLEALDRVTRQVVSTTGIGAPFPPTFAFELVRRR